MKKAKRGSLATLHGQPMANRFFAAVGDYLHKPRPESSSAHRVSPRLFPWRGLGQ